jgi:alkanesulfonate monooxygenase SsuD/methylene tetrahydromethanopterin reductase-like flavin-dependent oxidoreductase (luciferase family)
MDARLDAGARAMLGHALSQAIVGSPDTVMARLAEFYRRTGADEVMITSSIFDHGARVRSFEIVAEVNDRLAGAEDGAAQAASRINASATNGL